MDFHGVPQTANFKDPLPFFEATGSRQSGLTQQRQSLDFWSLAYVGLQVHEWLSDGEGGCYS